jgi:hypothetical protein
MFAVSRERPLPGEDSDQETLFVGRQIDHRAVRVRDCFTVMKNVKRPGREILVQAGATGATTSRRLGSSPSL